MAIPGSEKLSARKHAKAAKELRCSVSHHSISRWNAQPALTGPQGGRPPLYEHRDLAVLVNTARAACQRNDSLTIEELVNEVGSRRDRAMPIGVA